MHIYVLYQRSADTTYDMRHTLPLRQPHIYFSTRKKHLPNLRQLTVYQLANTYPYLSLQYLTDPQTIRSPTSNLYYLDSRTKHSQAFRHQTARGCTTTLNILHIFFAGWRIKSASNSKDYLQDFGIAGYIEHSHETCLS